ncbi:MAG: hypothetical protein NVS3B20_24390 [Polyangiales bacterium]
MIASHQIAAARREADESLGQTRMGRALAETHGRLLRTLGAIQVVARLVSPIAVPVLKSSALLALFWCIFRGAARLKKPNEPLGDEMYQHLVLYQETTRSPERPATSADDAAVRNAVPPAPRSHPSDLDDFVIPNEPSNAPTLSEWLKSKQRRTSNPQCHARLVREWLMIACEGPGTLASVTAIAGEDRDVVGWSRPDSTVVFPIHRGDRRLFSLDIVCEGAKFPFACPIRISEVWLEGMTFPEISVSQ